MRPRSLTGLFEAEIIGENLTVVKDDRVRKLSFGKRARCFGIVGTSGNTIAGCDKHGRNGVMTGISV
ncbi:MAG TPA: hypothetical protein VGA09_07705, partial [Candidatus Binatia bacterium]